MTLTRRSGALPPIWDSQVHSQHAAPRNHRAFFLPHPSIFQVGAAPVPSPCLPSHYLLTCLTTRKTRRAE